MYIGNLQILSQVELPLNSVELTAPTEVLKWVILTSLLFSKIFFLQVHFKASKKTWNTGGIYDKQDFLCPF